ncbi:MAG: hydrogenase nickel incorporation protein HypB [Thermoguttaceae bacterium]|nr:hydrogenase nickel incorporation protein HypB [Thermoguttaceae bacterium]MDW8037506.1 hydrogenase nickel incorporation protein HypB [Thermoguttaceae bacterium]
MKIVAASKILRANDALAAENRQKLTQRGVLAINWMGSPGSGKTTLLEALARYWQGKRSVAVIQGDVAGSLDAQRMEALGLPVVQINTDGACHLDANMVAQALAALPLEKGSLLMIENVGNLVCTAGFDLGEHLRLVVLSVPEGDDKLVKYPAIFRSIHALVISKTDLLPQVSFRLERVQTDLQRLNPRAAVFCVSAMQGEGIQELAQWLEGHQLRESMPL